MKVKSSFQCIILQFACSSHYFFLSCYTSIRFFEQSIDGFLQLWFFPTPILPKQTPRQVIPTTTSKTPPPDVSTALVYIFSLILNCSQASQKNSIIIGSKYRSRELLNRYERFPCETAELVLQTRCPSYHQTIWRKSALIQKPVAQISKAFHQHGKAEKTMIQI